MKIEPQYYVPVLPMVLVNGADGIGTGWATSVPPFNPMDIMNNIEERLMNPDYEFRKMQPWYNNFKGSIEKDPSSDGSYTVKGVWRKLDKHRIEITELPIKKWTRDYKNKLEEMMQKDNLIEDMEELHKDNTVHFVLKLKRSVTSI